MGSLRARRLPRDPRIHGSGAVAELRADAQMLVDSSTRSTRALRQPNLSINTIGHAMHDRDPVAVATLQVVDVRATYSPANRPQRPPSFPARGFL